MLDVSCMYIAPIETVKFVVVVVTKVPVPVRYKLVIVISLKLLLDDDIEFMYASPPVNEPLVNVNELDNRKSPSAVKVFPKVTDTAPVNLLVLHRTVEPCPLKVIVGVAVTVILELRYKESRIARATTALFQFTFELLKSSAHILDAPKLKVAPPELLTFILPKFPVNE